MYEHAHAVGPNEMITKTKKSQKQYLHFVRNFDRLRGEKDDVFLRLFLFIIIFNDNKTIATRGLAFYRRRKKKFFLKNASYVLYIIVRRGYVCYSR